MASLLPSLLFLAATAAPPITIESAPREFDAAKVLTITYAIAEAAELSVTEPGDWRVTETSRSSQMTVVNGVVTRRSALTVSLVATALGPLELPVVSGAVSGELVRSPETTVRVTGVLRAPPPADVLPGDAFLEWEAPPRTWVGVPVPVGLALWVRQGLTLTQLNVAPPRVGPEVREDPLTRGVNHPGLSRQIGGVHYLRIPLYLARLRQDRSGPLDVFGGSAAVVVGGVPTRLDAPALRIRVSASLYPSDDAAALPSGVAPSGP